MFYSIKIDNQMITASIWDEAQMDLSDRESYTINYKGENLDGDCIIAHSTASFVLFSAIVDHHNPIGFFIVKSSVIMNTLEYANGGPLRGNSVRSFLCPVYKLENQYLILIESDCPKPNDFIEMIISILNPKNIVIFFSESTTFPPTINSSKSNLQDNQSRCHAFPSDDTFFNLPFHFSGLPAGILIFCPIHSINYKLLFIENESSYESAFSVIISEMQKLINIDSNTVIERAITIMNERKAIEKMI